jgi:hypothetical protein
MHRRTQVFLTDEQYDFLHAERLRTGLSIGVLVRRAIDETYALRHPDAAVVGRRAGTR